ncbi:DUF456 domain-containing protein [Bacteroides sp. 224]|uniref:DUF456 domain-containing protein n=1 Tax=Bacteroides sp. 224 TaxID=2302936 RepID=UPI0013D0985E|nr:DUF456 domain-containing protein [Bacteroides sp. 224]NDV64377.1 DUF456 domain-containing protein [Bacteroides sp. 224]
MDIILIILGCICLLLGLIGCVLPILPGPPLAYGALLLLHITDKVQFTLKQLIIWLIIVIIVQVVDYFIPMLGTKKLGGTKWGVWGCLIGTIAGIFVFPPWGIIVGPFAGAFVGELLGGKETKEALKAGAGAFFGFLFGTILKFIVCGWFIYCFVSALI